MQLQRVNHWSESRTIEEIIAALTGEATRFVTNEILRMNSLDDLELRFRKHFRAGPAQNTRSKLINMEQSKDENVYDFGKRMKALLYNDISDAELAEYFIRGLHPKLKFEVAKIHPRPQSFDEMLEEASALEGAFEYVKISGRSTKNVAPITPEVENKFEYLVEELDKVIKTAQKGTPAFCRGRCYLCQKEGHLMRNCPQHFRNMRRSTERNQGRQAEHTATATTTTTASNTLMTDDKGMEETVVMCAHPGCDKPGLISRRTGKQAPFCNREHRIALEQARNALEAKRKQEQQSPALISIIQALQEMANQGNGQTPSDQSQLEEDNEYL